MSLFNSSVYVWPSLTQVQFKEMPFVLDRGLHFGDGVFETFRFSENQIPFLKAHLDRLSHGLERMKIPINYPIKNIYEWLKHSIKVFPAQDGVGKLIMTRGSWNGNILPQDPWPHLILFVRVVDKPNDFNSLTAQKLKIISFPKNQLSPICGIKTLNYAEHIIAKQEAQANGCDDGIFLNLDQYLTECSTSNIFFIKNNELITPDVSCGLLPGITRDILFKISESVNLKTSEKKLKVEDISGCEEIFISNSSFGIFPIQEIQGHWNSKGNYSKTELLFNEYWKYFDSKIQVVSV